MRTCTLYHNTGAMIQHVPPTKDYPECPERIVAIEGLLKGYCYGIALSFVRIQNGRGIAKLSRIPVRSDCDSVWSRCKNVQVDIPLSRHYMVSEYGEEEVRSWEHCLAPKGQAATTDGDNYWSEGTLYAAGVAAAASVQAANDILDRQTETAFCIVRPPGHHCFETPAGFCILNNVVLAAKEFLKAGKRVAILDWDYHFGDGTAFALLENPATMFVSLHCKRTRRGSPTYPHDIPNNLKGDGLSAFTNGRMFNIQWETDDADDAAYTYALQTAILPAIKEFGADVILISAGYDAVRGDDLAGMELNPSVFRYMSSALADLGLPTLAILEGGYNPELLAISVQETIEGFLQPHVAPPSVPIEPAHKQVVDSVVANRLKDSVK